TSFDPIIDRVSGKDLLEAMVFAREVGDWDFHGMHTAILYHEDAPGNEATPSGNDGQLGDGATHRLPALPDKAAYMEMKAQPPLPGSGPLANSSPATSAFNSPGVGLPVGAASPPAASPAVLLQAPSAPQGAAPIKGLPHSDQSAASTAGQPMAAANLPAAASVPIIQAEPSSALEPEQQEHGSVAAPRKRSRLSRSSYPDADIDALLAVPEAAPALGLPDAGIVDAEEKPKGKRPVAAAVFCAFGAGLAQLPFIATQIGERRRGHARSLCNAVESLLSCSGVATLCVPATYEAFPTWKGGLGFTDMPRHQLAAAKAFMGLLMFPGTCLLSKCISPGKETLGLDEHGQPIEPAQPMPAAPTQPSVSSPLQDGLGSEHRSQPFEPGQERLIAPDSAISQPTWPNGPERPPSNDVRPDEPSEAMTSRSDPAATSHGASPALAPVNGTHGHELPAADPGLPVEGAPCPAVTPEGDGAPSIRPTAQDAAEMGIATLSSSQGIRQGPSELPSAALASGSVINGSKEAREGASAQPTSNGTGLAHPAEAPASRGQPFGTYCAASAALGSEIRPGNQRKHAAATESDATLRKRGPGENHNQHAVRPSGRMSEQPVTEWAQDILQRMLGRRSGSKDGNSHSESNVGLSNILTPESDGPVQRQSTASEQSNPPQSDMSEQNRPDPQQEDTRSDPQDSAPESSLLGQNARPNSPEPDLEAPLLGQEAGEHEGKAETGPPGPAPDSDERQSSVFQSSSNLANTVVGAGIMALPHAIAVLGMVFGSAMLVLIYALARLTLSKLIKMSQDFKAQSYPQLVRKQLGRWGDLYLQASIIINNAGILVVYLIILGDIAVGSAPKYDGLLSTWFGLDAGHAWFLNRPFVVALLVVALLLPLSMLRQLSVLAKVSTVSLALAAFFAVTCVLLGTYAAVMNGVSNVRLWPGFGEIVSPTAFLGLVATLPVLATSFVCHYNLHPVMKDLKNYTEKRMVGTIDLGLGLCTSAYVMAGIGGYLLFGGHPAEDVLKNFTPAALTPLLGSGLASITEGLIRASYLVVLLCHAPIVTFGLRALILEIISGSTDDAGPQVFRGVTVSIVVFAYIASVLVPSVYTFLSITGATAALSLAYIIPALLMLKLEPAGGQRGLAWVILVACGLVSIMSIVHTFVQAA
ncbi:hypothetical protein WJX84_010859, partial [Apatococcus fuscideae]